MLNAETELKQLYWNVLEKKIGNEVSKFLSGQNEKRQRKLKIFKITKSLQIYGTIFIKRTYLSLLVRFLTTLSESEKPTKLKYLINGISRRIE